jgi:hypothetical protein
MTMTAKEVKAADAAWAQACGDADTPEKVEYARFRSAVAHSAYVTWSEAVIAQAWANEIKGS